MTDTTVAHVPPWAARERPTWGLTEGDAIAPGRTVLRRIGGGRRYETFLVWDEHRLAILVAKVLRPDQAGALAELAAEASLLSRLAHPVVVRGFGAVTGGRFPHLLLEHLEGPTLAELVARDGPLALEQLLALGLHLASALHYLANERVAHLDVKPPNVVMGAPAPLRRRTPRELGAILRAGLDPDPAARPTASDVALALEPLVTRGRR